MVTETKTTADSVRLLRCDTCGPPVEEVPWTSDDPGLPADYDDALLFVLRRHVFPDGLPHIGRLVVVEKRAWDLPNIRRVFMEQIWGGSRGFGELDVRYYDTSNQLRSDALTCFSRHGRPKEGCPDWRIESKKLLPDTREDRKDVGLSTDPRARSSTWLCSFCPCSSYYARKSRGD